MSMNSVRDNGKQRKGERKNKQTLTMTGNANDNMEFCNIAPDADQAYDDKA